MVSVRIAKSKSTSVNKPVKREAVIGFDVFGRARTKSNHEIIDGRKNDFIQLTKFIHSTSMKGELEQVGHNLLDVVNIPFARIYRTAESEQSQGLAPSAS